MKEEKTWCSYLPRLGILLDEISAIQNQTPKWSYKNWNSLQEDYILYVNDSTIIYSQNSLSKFETSNVIPNAPIKINFFQALFPLTP